MDRQSDGKGLRDHGPKEDRGAAMGGEEGGEKGMRKNYRSKFRPDYPADFEFDYKDPVTLGRFIMEGGKIVQTWNCTFLDQIQPARK